MGDDTCTVVKTKPRGQQKEIELENTDTITTHQLFRSPARIKMKEKFKHSSSSSNSKKRKGRGRNLENDGSPSISIVCHEYNTTHGTPANSRRGNITQYNDSPNQYQRHLISPARSNRLNIDGSHRSCSRSVSL